jgi:hypothetical protein
MNAGNAAASGYVGSANAWNNALGGAANMYQQNQLMNRIFPSASASPYTSASNFESRMGLPQTGYNRPY